MHDSAAGPRSFFAPLRLVSRSFVSASLLLLTVSSAAAVSGDEELVRQLARPVPSELVLPFQNDWDFRMGPLDEALGTD